MKNKIKVFHVAGRTYYSDWITNRELVTNLKDADIVVFEGGEDVDPSLYNEPKGAYTISNIRRDIEEEDIFIKALALKKPILGICRGSQLACVLSGGRLIQHQDNPNLLHTIRTDTGQSYTISSTHHQAQYPYDMCNDNYKLLAWANGESAYHLNGEDKEITNHVFKEAEIVFYRNTNALAIQGHPEMEEMSEYGDTLLFLNELVNKLINGTL